MNGEENSPAIEKYVENQNTSAATDEDQIKQSNLNNLLISGAPANVDKFQTLCLQESAAAMASDVDFSNNDENDNEEENDEEENNENDDEGEGDEGEGEDEREGEDEGEAEGEDGGECEEESEGEEGTSEAEAESGEDEGEAEGEGEEEEEENDEDVDDGPPVLSPIMPLLPENESEEHSNTMDRTRHKLSPMVALNMDKLMEGCEITEIKNDAENTAATSNASNFFGANNNDLPVTWDEDDERDCDSDVGDKDAMVVKDEEFDKEYAKRNMNDLDGDDYDEDSADENVMDDRDGGGGDQVHEIHSLDGTVLMMAKDAEGNPILIEHNVLDIDNDSNTEVAQYIYPDNAYEIEEEDEEDFATQNETDAMQTDEIQGTYVQDMSENDDSTGDDVEEDSSDAQK